MATGRQHGASLLSAAMSHAVWSKVDGHSNGHAIGRLIGANRIRLVEWYEAAETAFLSGIEVEDYIVSDDSRQFSERYKLYSDLGKLPAKHHP